MSHDGTTAHGPSAPHAPSGSRLRYLLGASMFEELVLAMTRDMHSEGAEFLAQEAAALAGVADYLADELRDVSAYDAFSSALHIAYRELRLQAARRLREARYARPDERTMIRHEYRRIHAMQAGLGR